MFLQEYQEQAREARRAAREDARQAAEEGNAIEPLSAVAQRRLKQEMPHELAGHCRAGVMSRWPHSLQDYQGAIDSTQVCCCPAACLSVSVKRFIDSTQNWGEPSHEQVSSCLPPAQQRVMLQNHEAATPCKHCRDR